MTVKRLSDLSIRYKLFLSYFALILLFLGLFLVINAILVTRENTSQVLRSAEHVFAGARANLEYRTESIRNLLYSLTTNETIRELFERTPDYYRADIGRWPIDYQAFEKATYLTSINPDITGVHLVMKQGLASLFENDSIILMNHVTDAVWFKHLLADKRRVLWFADASGGGTPVIHAARSVFDSQNVNNLNGVVEFDVRIDGFRNALTDALLTKSTFAFVVNSYGEIIEAVGSSLATSADAFWAEISSARAGRFENETWSTTVIAGRSYLVGARDLSNTDWTLVLVVPYSDVAQMGARPARLMLLVFALITPFPLFMAFFVSQSATKRIRNLIQKMGHVVRGDFSVTLDPGNRDEIGELTERFNFMILEVEQLIEEKYALGKEVKNLELKALQAQINPHFLYNTLDLINWMAVRRNASEIEAVVEALSRFYKLSLSKGEDTVRLAEELEHAKTYAQIQNMRYEDSVTFIVVVPQELLDIQILKLVVQPLVENAIFHGIMMKTEERGSVRISAALDQGDLVLSVKDDGIGMTEEQLASLRNGEKGSSDYHGYGVRNIDERLRLRYGPDYGLSFESSPGSGTTVQIRIPAQQCPSTG